MLWSGLTWRNIWKLLTINFKYKYFHNSVDWSGLYLQVSIPSWLTKILRFTVFTLLENAFVKLLCPWHDLINNLLINPLANKNICPKKFVPHLPWKAFRKRSLHTLWGETHFIWEYMLPQYLQGSADKTCWIWQKGLWILVQWVEALYKT